MLDRAKRMGRNAQALTLAESVRNQRDLAEVRQEPAAGLVISVADIVAGHDALAGQFAHTRHGNTFVLLQPDGSLRANARRADPIGPDWKVAVL